YDKIKAAGADLVAISVDNQSFGWSMGQTTGARFKILSDPAHKVIDQYGVFNPNEHGGIAFPSTFVLDKSGTIRFMYVGKNPTDRPLDTSILDEVKKATAASK
ncbi:MAG TPA: redoxin domain-containing protein, partial [Blastocatellia bacterium]|nr:redoxin domain-containing protein [Blastocatellia bacterium]